MDSVERRRNLVPSLKEKRSGIMIYRAMTTTERWMARLIVGTASLFSLAVALSVFLKDLAKL
jgi:hypothetical protein